jgi:hypothetical protein
MSGRSCSVQRYSQYSVYGTKIVDLYVDFWKTLNRSQATGQRQQS